MKSILVVAHPDDEILFFSSIIENVDKVLICFGPSGDNEITLGRTKLQVEYPLKHVQWLNLDQSNVHRSSSWKKPVITVDGVKVNRDQSHYRRNYHKLIDILKEELKSYDIIYTHNPWGEYGHEEHLTVFNTVLELLHGSTKKLNVSAYVSDRSLKLFDMRKYLIDGELEQKFTPKQLCSELKKLYINCHCWTWDESYEWPDSEIFLRINTDLIEEPKSKYFMTANPPIMMLTRTFEPNPIKSMMAEIASIVLPKPIKEFIKKLMIRH